MCEQAARSCRAGVHRLLRKPPPALRGLDGLLRWVVARMSDKGVADRELLTPGAASQRKGTSVILDIFRRADKNGTCTKVLSLSAYMYWETSKEAALAR